MVSIIYAKRSGEHLDKAFGLLGSPAFLCLAILSKLSLYQIVLALYAYGREAQRAQLKNHRSVDIAL